MLELIQKYLVPMEGEEELVEEIFVRKIQADVPKNAFYFATPIPVYAAGMGNANDFIGVSEQVDILGDSGGAVDVW